MSKIVFIDPGHGGDSIGASYKGRLEQDDTLKLGLTVGEYLKAQGIQVIYSRSNNTNPLLTQRTNRANDADADYFLSIHRNAFKPNQANGVEAWVYSKCVKGNKTYNMAENIVNKICEATGFYNRGVKFGAPSYKDYAVNRDSKMDSCLLECGFIDSDKDNDIFDKKFKEIAIAITKAVCENLGVEYKEVPVASNKILYKVQCGAFSNKQNAENLVKRLRVAGFDAIITEI